MGVILYLNHQVDEITVDDVYVRKIHALDVNLEVICAHPDAKIIQLW